METINKENIILAMESEHQPEDFLEDGVYMQFLDMYVVPREVIELNEHGATSRALRKAALDVLGMSKNELFLLAKENWEKRFSAEIVETFPNTYHIGGSLFGATEILTASLLSEIAEMEGNDLIIAPLSVCDIAVHPMGALSNEAMLGGLMANNIQMANDGLTDNILSCSLYHYHRDTGEVTLHAKVDSIEVR